MTAMTKLLITSALLLAMTVGANAAGTCLKIDDDNSPTAVVSGRVSHSHQVARGSETRAADGPFLILDQALKVDLATGRGCVSFRKIVVFTDRRLNAGDHMKVTGKLNRFGSALVDPPIFIEESKQ